MNQTQTPEIITVVAKTIVARLAGELTSQQRAEQEQQVQQLFLARLGTAMLEALPAADRLTYQTKFIETQQYNSPAAQTFLTNNIPNLEQLLTNEAKQFIEEFSK